jgi:predicted Na+-dependent transporter
VRHAVAAVSVLLGVLFVPFIVGQLFSEQVGHAIESA